MEIDNKYIKFNANYEVKDDSTVVFTDYFERKLRVTDVKDYDWYKKDLENIVKYAGEKVVISR